MADGILQTADAVIQMADGILQTADAVIQTADGILQTVDAVIQTADGIIQMADAIIQMADGMIQKRLGIRQTRRVPPPVPRRTGEGRKPRSRGRASGLAPGAAAVAPSGLGFLVFPQPGVVAPAALLTPGYIPPPLRG